jgi:phosphonate transport system permease protein
MTAPAAFPRTWTARRLAMLMAAVLVLAVSAHRMAVPAMLARAAEAALGSVGIGAPSEAGLALGAMAGRMWPPQLSDRRDTTMIDDFDPARLPPFTHVETQRETARLFDPETLKPAVVTTTTVWLVHPFGYLLHVMARMAETIEIALWGTLLAVGLGLPLGLAGARPLMPAAPVRQAARALCAMLRAVPELLSALFLVSAFGFGPSAGILALGFHAAGYLGKFYPDAIEDAQQAPVRALQAAGAGTIATIRFALWPQVRAPFVSATFYILDRNVRMATIVGIVGAGGIGQELKGRIDMYEYGHVGTILIAILAVIIGLDQIAARLRRRAA